MKEYDEFDFSNESLIHKMLNDGVPPEGIFIVTAEENRDEVSEILNRECQERAIKWNRPE